MVPITRWFPHYFRYGWATNIKFDLLAAITIAFMLIPQVRTLFLRSSHHAPLVALWSHGDHDHDHM